jgi:hypothetical protein
VLNFWREMELLRLRCDICDVRESQLLSMRERTEPGMLNAMSELMESLLRSLPRWDSGVP